MQIYMFIWFVKRRIESLRPYYLFHFCCKFRFTITLLYIYGSVQCLLPTIFCLKADKKLLPYSFFKSLIIKLIQTLTQNGFNQTYSTFVCLFAFSFYTSSIPDHIKLSHPQSLIS